jgi:branched-chain amino acid aminotransferase
MRPRKPSHQIKKSVRCSLQESRRQPRWQWHSKRVPISCSVLHGDQQLLSRNLNLQHPPRTKEHVMNDASPLASTIASSRFADGVAFIDGEYVPIAEAKIPLMDYGFLRSDACQDTISVWKGQYFRRENHIDRFERSCSRLRFTSPYSREQIRDILDRCCALTGFENAYLQMIMTRGFPPIGQRDLRKAVNRFQLFCLRYVWIASPEVQERGMHVMVSPIRRVPPESVDPEVKHYHWLDFDMALFSAYDAGYETVLLTDFDGNVAEGPGFNVFAIKEGELLTPDANVLDGMTRRTVFELAGELNLKARLAKVSPEDLQNADEVFLSSTAGGIMPVSSVDKHAIGDGKPGPTTTRLRSLYWSKREAGWHAIPVNYAIGAAVSKVG